MNITRDQIIAMLVRWQAGEISAAELQAWAGERSANSAFAMTDWENDEWSVSNEILGVLDQLDAMPRARQ